MEGYTYLNKQRLIGNNSFKTTNIKQWEADMDVAYSLLRSWWELNCR